MPETRNVTIEVIPERPRAQIVSVDMMRRYAMEYARLQDFQWMTSANAWGSITIDPPAEVIPEDGYPMETIRHTSFTSSGRYGLNPAKHVMLFMGGEWVRGGWNRETNPQCFSSVYSEANGHRPLEWDRANQPTRWKPLPR